LTLLSLSAANADLIELHHDGVRVLVSVRRSDRSRRIRLRVTEEGAEVVLPRRSARRHAVDAVREHAAWLVRHVGRLTVEPDDSGTLGVRIMFEGRWRSVHCTFTGRSSVLFDGESLVVSGSNPLAALESWMRKRAAEMFDESLKRRSKEMGLVPSRVSLRDQKTKWGACTSRGTVTFNWRLVMALPDVLDYVVVHELAHLQELNHSARYWKIVESYCPEHKVYRKWLRENGRYLQLPKAFPPSVEPDLN